VTSDAKDVRVVAARAPEATDVLDGALDEREAAPPAPLEFRTDRVIEIEAPVEDIGDLKVRW